MRTGCAAENWMPADDRRERALRGDADDDAEDAGRGEQRDPHAAHELELQEHDRPGRRRRCVIPATRRSSTACVRTRRPWKAS